MQFIGIMLFCGMLSCTFTFGNDSQDINNRKIALFLFVISRTTNPVLLK